jgi:hypothetical protein
VYCNLNDKKKNKRKQLLSGFLSTFGFKGAVSFLLAWINCLTITNASIFIETLNWEAKWIEVFSFCAHTSFFCLVILFLAYYDDGYYVLIIFLFQLGIILTNLDKYTTDNKFTLVFGILTLICLLVSLCSPGETENKDEDGEDDEEKLLKKSKMENNRSEFTKN